MKSSSHSCFAAKTASLIKTYMAPAQSTSPLPGAKFGVLRNARGSRAVASESDSPREEILAPTAPRICSACPTCLEECDPQEGPGHPLQSQAERNLLCRERATYLHSKQVAADGKSVRYGSVINCCNCRLYLAQGAGAGGPGHSSSMGRTD